MLSIFREREADIVAMNPAAKAMFDNINKNIALLNQHITEDTPDAAAADDDDEGLADGQLLAILNGAAEAHRANGNGPYSFDAYYNSYYLRILPLHMTPPTPLTTEQVKAVLDENGMLGFFN